MKTTTQEIEVTTDSTTNNQKVIIPMIIGANTKFFSTAGNRAKRDYKTQKTHERVKLFFEQINEKHRLFHTISNSSSDCTRAIGEQFEIVFTYYESANIVYKGFSISRLDKKSDKFITSNITYLINYLAKQGVKLVKAESWYE